MLNFIQRLRNVRAYFQCSINTKQKPSISKVSKENDTANGEKPTNLAVNFLSCSSSTASAALNVGFIKAITWLRMRCLPYSMSLMNLNYTALYNVLSFLRFVIPLLWWRHYKRKFLVALTFKKSSFQAKVMS